MLLNEFEEITKSVHQTFEHYRHWFIYFTGVNLVGYGWFAQQLVQNKSVAKWFVFIVFLFFLLQHILADRLTNKLVDYLKSCKIRSTLLLEQLDKKRLSELDEKHLPEFKANIACPFDLYIKVLELAKITFPSMFFLWLAFTIFAFKLG